MNITVGYIPPVSWNSPGETPNSCLKPDELPQINPAMAALQGRCQYCRPETIRLRGLGFRVRGRVFDIAAP